MHGREAPQRRSRGSEDRGCQESIEPLPRKRLGDTTAASIHWTNEGKPASALLSPTGPPETSSDILPDRVQFLLHNLPCTFFTDEVSATWWPDSCVQGPSFIANRALPVVHITFAARTVWTSRRRRCGASINVPFSPSFTPTAVLSPATPFTASTGLYAGSVTTTVQPWRGRSMRTHESFLRPWSLSASKRCSSAVETTWGRKMTA